MYPGHNTRGGTSIHGSGLGPRMPMANQMVPPGIRAFNQNPAPNPNYLYNQHGAMNMMMQMGSNYKWQMMAQYGAPMMPQMYNNQNQQMPMYNPGLTQTSNQVSQPSPPVTISNRNSMKLPTIVCPSEEPKRPTQQQQQPQKTSGPRRSSKSSPAYGQNQGRQNAPAQQPPSYPPIDSSRVLDISPMESNGSNGSLATHMNPMHRAPGAISERSRSSESTSSSSLSQGIGNGTGNKGSLRGFRTEIHDSSTVIVISPCSSPRIKSEPVDDYWTSYRNGFSANTNGYLNNVQTVSPVNTPAVSTWSTNIAPPLPSLTTWAQEMSPSSRMRPTLPPSIPPPPPLMSSTSVQSGNQLHNAVVLPTAPQVIPVSIGIPNLLQEPVVTTAPSPISAWTESRNQHQNLPANDTTASSIPAASSISYPLPVVRHSSSETQVVERAPIMSKILSSSISINVQSQPITTSNTLSSCSTQVSSCASVTPLPAALQASNLQTERSIAQIASSTGSTKAESSTSGTYTPSVPITMGSPSYGGFIPILPKPPILNVPSFVNGTSSTKTCQVMQAPLTTPHLLESLSLPSLPPRPRTNIPTEKMYLACQICSYVGKSAQALERHYNAHSKNQVCRFCKKAYELVSKLRTHEKQHLAAGDILPEDGAQFSQDSVSVTTCNDTSGTDLPSPLSNSESSSGSNVLEIQPEVAHCESASSDNQPAMANTQSSTDPSSALDGQGASPSNELNLKNLPFRIDHFMNSVLTETSLFQCDVDDNNEITISFAPFVIGETDLDLIKLCPPVATIGDISEIMEGVRKATDSVDVKVLEVIMPKTKKRKKDSSEEGSKKKKKKKLMGYLKLEKKKKSKRKRRSGSNLDDEDEVAVDSSQHNDGTSVGAGDETSDIQLPGNYVADPVHYDTMTDDSITSPHRALLSPKSTQSTLLSPNKTTPNGKISPKKDNSTSNVTPAETQEGSVPGKYKCTTCSFTTDVKMKLKGHEKAHEMNLHMCEFCYKTFFKMADLVRHVDSTHKQNQEPKSDEERDGLSFSCDCCDYQTDLYARFKMHQNLHKTGQNICQWCGKALFNVEHLVRHWFTHNKKDNLNRYTCNLCQYKVSEKQQMTSHMTSHYKEKPVGLPSKPSLTKGKKSKVKDSSACPECGAVFTLPSLLSSHRRKVHNVVSLSTYKCDACDVSYMSQRKLQRHVMEKHTSAGNNPPVTVQQTHTCNVCERKFASAAYLARHAVVHSTEKHFKCKSCSKRFTYHHHMNMHQRKCFKPKNAVKKATPVTKGGGGGDIKLGDVLKINTSNKLNQLASNVSQKSPKVGADAPVPDHVSIADDDDDIIFLDFEIIPET